MRAIQMVDLRNQYLQIKDEVDKAIQEVLDTTTFINGPAVKEFSANLARYLGASHVVPCANGTDALQIAMMAAGLQPGDEVITPSFTYIATTEVIALLRLHPVFVEVNPRTFCIDPASIQKAITPRTKAIIPVHLYGQSAPMEAIMDIALHHNLVVIEDNAQAIGCQYTYADGRKAKTGTIGQFGCTSFYPSKNLGAFGDGGAISTNDSELADKMSMITNHGQTRQYYHDIVGCNSRLDSIQAALLNVKLRSLDDYIAARKKNAYFYDQIFANQSRITVPFIAPYSDHVYHQYTIIVEGADRNELRRYLAANQIPSMIYYPVPAHRQKMFEGLSTGTCDLPVTDRLAEQVISLPMHTELDEEQLHYIASKVLDFLNNH